MILVGGPAAVSDSVVASIQSLGISVLRIARLTYGDTSTQLAEFEVSLASAGFGWHESSSKAKFDVALVRGDSFADALTSSEVTGGDEELVLLATDPEALGSEVTAFLNSAGSAQGIYGLVVAVIQPFGGTLALKDAVLQAALQASPE